MQPNTPLEVMQQKPILYAPFKFSQDTILRLTNTSDKRIAWKVKCSANDRYKLRPVTGIVEAGAYKDVHMHIHPIDQPPAALHDKVCIYAKNAGDETDSRKLWKAGNEEDTKQTIRLAFFDEQTTGKNGTDLINHVSIDSTQSQVSSQQ